MRLLVVEDYRPLRTSVAQALREEGYSVDESERGDDGYALAQANDYDVILLDLMLPGLGGFEFLTQLRADGRRSHVLILTARDALDDRIRGLDLGGDDYLVKPFAMQELLARVRALLRREYVQKAPTLEVGHVHIHTVSHTVMVDGDKVEFTAKEYALLEYLARRSGQVVSRLEIWEHLYDENSTTMSNVVDVYIGYLRKKIEIDGRPKLLVTRRGEGYLFMEPPA